jgi:hypothetical protein
MLPNLAISHTSPLSSDSVRLLDNMHGKLARNYFFKENYPEGTDDLSYVSILDQFKQWRSQIGLSLAVCGL